LTPERLPLDSPLPAELAPRLAGGLAAYREFPTFSAPWLLRRTLLFGAAIGAFGALCGFGLYERNGDAGRALWLVLQFTGGGLGMASAGPLLATMVRHRRLSASRERTGIVLALLVGLALAFVLDGVTSEALDATLQQPPDPPPRDTSPVALLVNGAVLLVIYGLLGGGLALGRYLREHTAFRDAQNEREIHRLRALAEGLDRKLSLLQAQIEPHFLFNTLASVRSLIASDPGRAAHAIDLLVDYLRATIPHLRGAEVTSDLGQQLLLCERYLALMAARTGRLSFSIDTPEPLRSERVPPLLLMTLVENAIKHGIEPKPGPGHVALRVRDDGDTLVVCVEDDGAGLREGLSSGLGLHNLREQLRLRYGTRAAFTLRANRGAGVSAELRIPKDPR
jgi:hypothetical protein